MERITFNKNGIYAAHESKVKNSENGFTGEAIEKLAVFENIYDELLSQQDKITEELADLRNAGKEKSCKFKELMCKKLNNTTTISLFKAYGLK